MNLFLITFRESIYDQYNGFVIMAKTLEDAIALLKEKYPEDLGLINWKSGYVSNNLNELDLKKPKIILGSYNAG